MKLINGQPEIIPSGETRIEICCDCGLCHLTHYGIRIHKGKRVIEQISYRDDWETQRKRNAKNKHTKSEKSK